MRKYGDVNRFLVLNCILQPLYIKRLFRVNGTNACKKERPIWLKASGGKTASRMESEARGN
jgi:hypothetical protein